MTPIVLDASSVSVADLRELLKSQDLGIQETIERFESPDLAVHDPGSVTTALDLLKNARTLSAAVGSTSEVPKAVLVGVVNLQYDVIVAAIDLLKSHTDVPKVPRRR